MINTGIRRTSLYVSAVLGATMLVAGCSGKSSGKKEAEPESKILPGSISDAMIDYASLRSKAGPVEDALLPQGPVSDAAEMPISIDPPSRNVFDTPAEQAAPRVEERQAPAAPESHEKTTNPPENGGE